MIGGRARFSLLDEIQTMPYTTLAEIPQTGTGPVSSQQKQNDSVDHTCRDAVHQHRTGDGKELDRRAGDQALCLCQLRTHWLVFY